MTLVTSCMGKSSRSMSARCHVPEGVIEKTIRRYKQWHAQQDPKSPNVIE